MTLVEQHFQCPNCGERISMVLDLTSPDQEYVEDCEVCCQPVEISYHCDQQHIVSFHANRSDA